MYCNGNDINHHTISLWVVFVMIHVFYHHWNKNVTLEFIGKIFHFNLILISFPLSLFLLVSTGTATVPASTTPTTVGTGPTATDTPVYERLPFIIGMIVLALLICFVCFIVLLCFIRPKSGGVTEKYEVMSRQTSPVRDDGTVRASWGPVMEPKISVREIT